MLGDIEEVIAAQMLVPLGMIGVDAGGLQRDVDLALLRLGRIEAEVAVEVVEGAPQPAVTKVADLEVDEGVLAFLVDGVIGRECLAADQCGPKDQFREGFLENP